MPYRKIVSLNENLIEKGSHRVNFLSPKSAWPAERVASFLDETRVPMRLATRAESGFPILCSLWFLYDEGRLLCATQGDAMVVRALSTDPRCAFEISTNEMPYFGFRGRGSVEVGREGAVDALERLIDRYLGGRDSGLAKWLLSRAENEVYLSIEIDWATSWDFSQRMSS